MSLTKLIVVVDADCDVHDYAEVAWRAFGNVDYAHDLLLTSRARSTTSTTPPTSSSGAARRASTPPASCPSEGYTRDGGWPRDGRADPEIVGQGRPALEGVRPVSSATRRAHAAAGAAVRSRVPAAGDDRALGVRAAVRLHRRADRDVRRDRHGRTGAAAAGHDRDGRRAHVRDGRQPDHRPRDRRPQPAHRAAANWSPARVGAARPGPARSSRSPSSSARRPLLNPLCLVLAAARGRAAGRLPVRQAVHRLPARHPRRWPRRSARSAPGSRSPATWSARAAVRARARGRHLDRRLRPDLRLPGRRDRPARSACTSVPARFGIAGRAARVARVVARGDVRAVRLVRRCSAGLRLAVVGRAGR